MWQIASCMESIELTDVLRRQVAKHWPVLGRRRHLEGGAIWTPNNSGQARKRRDSDPHKHNRRDAVVIGFGLTLAVLVVGGGVGYINAGRLAYHNQWVAHTHEVIGQLEALLSTLKDAETGSGYLLAGKLTRSTWNPTKTP